MEYRTKGVCSRMIKLELDGDIIRSVEFVGGCSGNTQGVARLVEGMKVDDAIARMEGIQCGPRPTSCPDQLAQALKQLPENKRKGMDSFHSFFTRGELSQPLQIRRFF
mgnify:CR=1 FL=1